MKILALIPARSGSKGVPDKNVKLLRGKPLLGYTIAKALEAAHITRTLVSTDAPEIRAIALSLGAEAPFLRPPDLAQDSTPTLPVVQHALTWLIENEGVYFDAVCLLQPTNPFRAAGFIDRAIGQFAASGADSLISVLPVPVEYNPHWVFEKTGQGYLQIVTGERDIIPRRQELPPAFFRDGSVYVTKSAVILDRHSLYGDTIAYIESDPACHCNIDTMEDWLTAEKMAANLCAE